MPAGFFCNNPCTMSKKASTAMQKTCSVACAACSEVYKASQKLWFCRMMSISATRACQRQKTSPNVVLKALKPGPDDPKSRPGRPKARKNDQHEPKKYKKRSRTSQERPRAKKVPTWPQHGSNMGRFWPRFQMCWPPPNACKAVC